MKNYTKLLMLCFCCGLTVLLSCTRDNPIHTSYDGPLEIRPLCKLASSLSIDEIGAAEAIVSGKGIEGTLTFELLVDRTDSKLYGTLKLPEGATSCDVIIRIYDLQERKIGEGSYSLTQSHFNAGRYVTPQIGIESAKPRIDTVYTRTNSVGINDSIALHAAASDSFGGTIKYEWKCGNGGWFTDGDGDTIVTAPPTAQAYVCSLRVTDDDGNSIYDAVTVTVGARAPVAVASAPASAGINDAVTLKGSGSSDETSIVEYAWKCGNGGWLTDGDGDTIVTAPSTAQAWVCSLKVIDDDGNVAYAYKTVTVETRAPVAVATAPASAGINDAVTLTGSGSSDETSIVEYAWKCGNGDWLTDGDGDTIVTAPSTAQAYVCSLRVNDDEGNSTYDAVTVTVEMRAPVAVAAGDTMVFVNDQVHLYGSGSYDETEIVEFAWKIGGGSWASVSTGDTTITTPGTEQTLVCSLRVSDDEGNIAFGTVSVLTVATSIKDADGNTYTTVIIGTQAWTVENLRTTKYNDETPIPHVTDSTEWSKYSNPAYSFYNNSTDLVANDKWGALYNWHAVNTGKLAPAGWHVPTDAEWTTLENFLIANGYNWDGTTSGNKIGKSLAARTDWSLFSAVGTIGNDLSKNNASGFSALPGGYRDDNWGFSFIGSHGYWWSATEYGAGSAWFRFLDYNGYGYLGRGSDNFEGAGLSVRLLRD